MSILLIKQLAGLGDIFFTQKIAHNYLKLYDKIYWPVIEHYKYIREYIKHPNIIFDSPPSMDNIHILDLQNAGSIYTDISFMDAKYKLVDVPFYDWKDYFNFERNIEREEKVWERYGDARPYNLICNKFASPPHEQNINIKPNNGLINIYIEYGFTPFDWCGMIEKAENLFFVDTCFTYIIEKLNIKDRTGMYLYSRNFNKNESPTYIATKHLFNKPWKYIHKQEDL